jgi:hypothetical protein
MVKGKLKVRVAALVARVNRRLVASGEALRRCRTDHDRESVGDWYVLDLSQNAISRKHVDLEQFAREVGALAEFEALAS